MYSKDMMIGILLSIAKMKLNISVNDRSSIGYEVRLSLVIRGDKEFLEAIQRDFLMYYSITCSVKTKESKTRPRPILTVGGIKNLEKITDIVPKNLPSFDSKWKDFTACVAVIKNKKHKTLDGLESLMKIKGYLNGINQYE